MGLLAFELVTGRRVFDGHSLSEIVAKHLEALPPALSEAAPSLTGDLAGGLDALIHKCLQKRPEDRYANGGELRLAFEAIRSLPGATSRFDERAKTPSSYQATAIMPGYSATGGSSANRTPAAAPVASRPAVSALGMTEATGPTIAAGPETPMAYMPPPSTPRHVVAPQPVSAVPATGGQPGWVPVTVKTDVPVYPATPQAGRRAKWPIFVGLGAVILITVGVFAGKAIWGSGNEQSPKVAMDTPAPKTDAPEPAKEVLELKPAGGMAAEPAVAKPTEKSADLEAKAGGHQGICFRFSQAG